MYLKYGTAPRGHFSFSEGRFSPDLRTGSCRLRVVNPLSLQAALNGCFKSGPVSQRLFAASGHICRPFSSTVQGELQPSLVLLWSGPNLGSSLSARCGLILQLGGQPYLCQKWCDSGPPCFLWTKSLRGQISRSGISSRRRTAGLCATCPEDARGTGYGPTIRALATSIRDARAQFVSNWHLGQSGGPYEDLEAFLHRADELAHSLLEQGITGMKIWPFDIAAER